MSANSILSADAPLSSMREYRGRASFSFSFCTILLFAIDGRNRKEGEIKAPLEAYFEYSSL